MASRLLPSILIVVLLSLSIFSLDISPLPWFDEVVFSSISESLANGLGLVRTCAPPFAYVDGQVFTYGPVYFTIVAGVNFVFGTHELTIRAVSLIFGLLSIGIISSVFFPRSMGNLKLLFIGIVMADIIFTSNSHGGRMDTTAMFFWFLGLYYFQKNSNQQSNATAIISGFILAMGYLTTPRSLLIYWPILLFVCYAFYSQLNLKQAVYRVLTFGLAFGLPIFIWIFATFGSIEAYIEFFGEMSKRFIGTNSLPPSYQWFIILIFCITVIWSASKLSNSPLLKKESFLSTFLLCSFISFYTLVNDTGTYSVFIIPLYYAITLKLLAQLMKPKWFLFLPLLLLFFNTSLSALKYGVVLSGKRTAKKEQVNNFIAKHIPSKSKLVGDEMYYYASRRNEVHYQFMHLYLEDSVREAYQREVYDYDYLFVSDRLQREKPQLVALYQLHSDLIPIDTLKFQGEIPDIPIINTLRKRILNSYDGVLYKRIKSP